MPRPAPGHPIRPRPFAWEQAPWGWVLTCPPLAPLGRHGFTIRDLDPGRGVGGGCRLGRGRRVARPAARVGVAARPGARLPRRAGGRGDPAGRRSAAVGGRRDHHADRRRRRREGRRLRADPDGASGWRRGRGPRRLARHRAGDRGPHRGRSRGGGRRVAARHRRRDRAVDRAVLLRGRARGPRDVPRRGLRGERISIAGSCRRNRPGPRTSSTCGARTAIS